MSRSLRSRFPITKQNVDRNIKPLKEVIVPGTDSENELDLVELQKSPKKKQHRESKTIQLTQVKEDGVIFGNYFDVLTKESLGLKVDEDEQVDTVFALVIKQ